MYSKNLCFPCLYINQNYTGRKQELFNSNVPILKISDIYETTNFITTQ